MMRCLVFSVDLSVLAALCTGCIMIVFELLDICLRESSCKSFIH